MKNFILSACSLLILGTACAKDRSDVPVLVTVEQQEEAVPAQNSFLQTLWNHKGKIAIGVSLAALAIAAYYYHDNIMALCNYSHDMKQLRQEIEQLKQQGVENSDRIAGVYQEGQKTLENHAKTLTWCTEQLENQSEEAALVARLSKTMITSAEATRLIKTTGAVTRAKITELGMSAVSTQPETMPATTILDTNATANITPTEAPVIQAPNNEIPTK